MPIVNGMAYGTECTTVRMDDELIGWEGITGQSFRRLIVVVFPIFLRPHFHFSNWVRYSGDSLSAEKCVRG